MHLINLVLIFFQVLRHSYCLEPEVAPQASIANRVLKGNEVLQVTSINFGKENGKYPSGKDNSIVFTGQDNCIPQIICDKLEIHEKCNLEYLMISDELYSHKVLCGSTPMKKSVRATNNILKLRFRTAKVPSKKPKAGFRCTVSCLSVFCGGGTAKPTTEKPIEPNSCDGVVCHKDAICETRSTTMKKCQCNSGFAGNGELCGPDQDKDGIPDEKLKCKGKFCEKDNCIDTPNSGQEDLDKDGKGDTCDEDVDNDGILNKPDNCIRIPNPDQGDQDKDKLGDACDPCPTDSNTFCVCQGDICLTMDRDHDGVMDGKDNCPLKPNKNQKDGDSDKVGDVCDNCPKVKNLDQADSDVDGVGDLCDDDIDKDKDGVQDTRDNCPTVYNPDQLDTDHDGKGDACDDDKDNDTIPNLKDNCPLVPNKDQKKTNPEIKEGDACAKDKDGDGVKDEEDVCSERNDITKVNFTNFKNVTLAVPANPKDREAVPVWVVRDNGAEIEEIENSLASMCLADPTFAGVDFAGTVFVNTNTDDDYIGFIFSYQNLSNYYAFMWKKENQSQKTEPYQITGGNMQLRLISIPGKVVQEVIWYRPSPDNPTVKALWTYPADEGVQFGWNYKTSYRFSLIFRPRIGLIRITITTPDEVISSGNIINNVLKGGKIGILAFSQEHTIFSKVMYRCNERVVKSVHAELDPDLQKLIAIDESVPIR